MHYRANARLAVLLATTIACGTATAQQTVQPLTSQGLRIMLLGDSITSGLPGTGGFRAPLFQALTSQLFEVDFVGSAPPNTVPDLIDDWHHEGHDGWTLENLAAFPAAAGGPGTAIELWLDLFDPSVILLHAGTNDLAASQLTANKAANRLSILLNRIYAHSPEMHVIVAEIVPLSIEFYDPKWAVFNEHVVSIAESLDAAGFSISTADMFTAFTAFTAFGHPQQLFTDAVHPSQLGYDVMATVWFQAMAELVNTLGIKPINPPLAPAPSVQTTDEVDQDGAFAALTDDLIARGSATLLSEAHFNFDGAGIYATGALNDGDASPGALRAADPVDESWVSTYRLDPALAARGYDINEIRGLNFAGGPPGAGGFGAQSFSVRVETVDQPGVFKLIGSYRYAYRTGSSAPSTGGSGEMRLRFESGPMATGVTAIRFRFNADPGLNAVTGYTEIDVIGHPTKPALGRLIDLSIKP